VGANKWKPPSTVNKEKDSCKAKTETYNDKGLRYGIIQDSIGKEILSQELEIKHKHGGFAIGGALDGTALGYPDLATNGASVGVAEGNSEGVLVGTKDTMPT
jgi:hypothetical protein